MSLLNQFRSGVNPVEAENPSRIKQFNASGIQRSEKKKALADVKNIIHQKTVQSSTKLSNIVKPTTFGGKSLFNVKAEKSKMPQVNYMNKPSEDHEAATLGCFTIEKENDIVYTCKCDEISAYDYTDMLFEGLKLTKSQIENYALNWENTPDLTSESKRALISDEDLKQVVAELDFGYLDPLEILLETIPEIKNFAVEVPPPFFEDYDEEDSSFD